MSVLYLGLDVHKDSVVVAVFDATSSSPQRVDTLPHDLPRLRRYFTMLGRDHTLTACYEASSVGYVLQRAMESRGHTCTIIAPSLIPRRPGDHRKTDHRDAVALARLFRAGELVPIRIPSEVEEQVRDLVRCREVIQREVVRSRHYITRFLIRRGFHYREGTPWATRHFQWLARIAHERTSSLATDDRLVLGEYLALLEYKLGRRDALDHAIEQRALLPCYRPAVERLRTFRGINTQAAMVLATEIGDWRRFSSPRDLMAYLGLVPREHSSGTRERRGAITKAGNSRCRHVLVQAAWCARHRPACGPDLQRRQRDQPAAVVAHAWKAQHRLHRRFRHLADRRSSAIAAVAVARELVGFLWAAMQDVYSETVSQRSLPMPSGGLA